MTSLIFYGLAAISAFALAPAALASDVNTVELEPGLYDYSHSVYVAGQLQTEDDYEYCITEGRNKKTLDELVAGLIEGGQCSASNVSMTSSTGRASVSCLDPDFGMRINGQFEADYGATFYTVNSTATINGGMPVRVTTKVRRRSACPIGWDNPDNVSPD